MTRQEILELISSLTDDQLRTATVADDGNALTVVVPSPRRREGGARPLPPSVGMGHSATLTDVASDGGAYLAEGFGR